MNALAINGSPRVGWNTHTLLNHALEGAHTVGARTELINLYDLDYKGCISCLECKRGDGQGVGRCAVRDALTPVLDKAAACDALILGSPIYLGEVTSAMRAFLERLLFQYISYEQDRRPYFERRIQTAFVFTMNAPDAILDSIGHTERFKGYAGMLERLLGPSRTLVSAETWQVEHYDQYRMSGIDGAQRKRRRDEVFPQQCRAAHDMGAAMARGASNAKGAS